MRLINTVVRVQYKMYITPRIHTILIIRGSTARRIIKVLNKRRSMNKKICVIGTGKKEIQGEGLGMPTPIRNSEHNVFSHGLTKPCSNSVGLHFQSFIQSSSKARFVSFFFDKI